jgi:hypothetical protein
VNVLAQAIGLKGQLPAESEQERAAHKALSTFTTDGIAIVLEQCTRPQTIGYSLLDSPVGLAAWMLDHDTDSYYKISRALFDGEPVGNLTRDNIVDDITLYWLTGTGASAARWFWESGRPQAAAGATARLSSGGLGSLVISGLAVAGRWSVRGEAFISGGDDVDDAGSGQSLRAAAHENSVDMTNVPSLTWWETWNSRCTKPTSSGVNTCVL